MNKSLLTVFTLTASYAIYAQVQIGGRVQIQGNVVIGGVDPVTEYVPVHNVIHFNGGTTGVAITTNDITTKQIGYNIWNSTAWTNVNGDSGAVFTNFINSPRYQFNIGGTNYQLTVTNSARYDHGSSPAQYTQGRFAVDLDNVSVKVGLATTFDGPGGGTYDLFQLQTGDGASWCSCNAKDETPFYVVAHTGVAGSGTNLYLPNGLRGVTLTGAVSNDICYIYAYNTTNWNLIGVTSHPMGTNSDIRYFQFKQFGHTAISGEQTVFSYFAFNTNGVHPLMP